MIIVRTPLRISLFGGGSDFPSYFMNHDGQILSTTIDKYVYVIVKERFDNNIRLGYSVTENVTNVNDLKHELAREAIKMFDLNGIEISTMADVPGGTGLGSSSAITVGLLHALYAYKGSLPSEYDLARGAIEIEIQKLNKPIGYQDQIISAYGGFSKIEFLDNFEVSKPEISRETLDALDKNLFLWYTNNIRDASSILEEQNKNTSKNLEVLNDIVDLCKYAEKKLIKGNVNIIGELLDESWELKKQLATKVSNDEIDELYDYAKKYGATGGKISGAGGGGFLLTYCPPVDQPMLKNYMKLRGVRELPFSFEPFGSRIIFDGR
jgi:D-glycero-alpha-D-manno-heptose-7-phosphate kinase